MRMKRGKLVGTDDRTIEVWEMSRREGSWLYNGVKCGADFQEQG